MSLRGKYHHAIETAKSVQMEGSAEVREGKLHVKAMVKNQDEANCIWDAIKTVPEWRNEVVAEIMIAPGATHTYLVKSGDTLSKIAQEHLGDANGYLKIFEANRDLLAYPDRIKPGQILKIPRHTHGSGGGVDD